MLIFVLNVFLLSSCSSDLSLNADTNLNLEEISVSSEDNFISIIGELHNDALDHAKSVIKKEYQGKVMSEAEILSTINVSLQAIMERYIIETQGRSMTSVEKTTFNNMMNDYSSQTGRRNLMAKIANSTITSVGSADLNKLYAEMNINRVP